LESRPQIQSFTGRQNGNTVVGDRAAYEHTIARLDTVRPQVDPRSHPSDAGGVDEDAIGRPPGHDLGITCDNWDRAKPGGVANAANHLPQHLQGQAFFDNKTQAQVQRLGSANHQIVHRTIYGQLADVAAGEEQWTYYVSVGGHRQAAIAGGEQRPVAEGPEEELPGDIDANLGAPWIPEGDIQAFAAELFRVELTSVPVAHLRKDAV